MQQLVLGAILLATIPWHAAASAVQDEEAWNPRSRNLQVEMLFPQGKSKALILSYDDGPVEDRQLVSLLNKYHLKGTFHLNAGKLSTKGIIDRAEVGTLYRGHEVSIHGYNHIGMKGLSDIDLFYEVGEDRRTLEMLSGRHVRGMAYPFGSYSEKQFTTLSAIGIEYARTVADTYAFGLPDNPLAWHPTVHQFAKAGYDGNTAEANQAEYAKFNRLTGDFLNAKDLALFYVWGHSWEYATRWQEVEEFFKTISNRDDVSYLTHIELVDYLNAYKRLKISADKSRFLNQSAEDVFIKVTNYADLSNPKSVVMRLRPGKSLSLVESLRDN